MPRAVYVLALGTFTMVTSEFLVAGLLPQLAAEFGVSVSAIGYLITAFGVAMAIGGPLLAMALMHLPPKTALLGLFALFVAGNVLAATAPGYGMLLIARLVTGAAAQAFWAVAISLCVRLARPEIRGRAIATVLNGLMLGTLLGLPLSTVLGEQLGWRNAFWAVCGLAVLAAAALLAGVPNLAPDGHGAGSPRSLAVFRSRRLWLALSTSTLNIGATFAAFSYFTPILTEVTGFGPGTVPILLIAYGAATVLGNTIVGRLADRHTIVVLLCGLAANTVFLTGFALLAGLPVPAVTCLLGIGLVGVTMNPAMVTRVQRAGNAGPMVNAIHSSFITTGVVIGSAVGGLAIDRFGLPAPLWLGAGLAVCGLLTVLPELARPAPAPVSAEVPERVSG